MREPSYKATPDPAMGDAPRASVPLRLALLEAVCRRAARNCGPGTTRCMARSTFQRGQTMIESAAAVAIFSLLAVALAGAAVVATRGASGNPSRDALARVAGNEALIAADVLKYDGSHLAPRTIETTVPLPNGSPLPASVSLSISPSSGGRLRVLVQAAAPGGERAAVTLDVPPPAPLPGSYVDAPHGAPEPTGAP